MKNFFLLLIFCLSFTFSSGQMPRFIAYKVEVESIVPPIATHDMPGDQWINLAIIDQRDIPPKKSRPRSAEVKQSLEAALRKAFRNVKLVQPGTNEQGAIYVEVNIIDCQAIFKGASWTGLMQFDLSVRRANDVHRQVVSARKKKFNSMNVGYVLTKKVYFEAYDEAITKAIAFVDQSIKKLAAGR